jgi:heavy metal translocating P-type ATPase
MAKWERIPMLIEAALLSGVAWNLFKPRPTPLITALTCPPQPEKAKPQHPVNIKRLFKDIKNALLSTERQQLQMDIDPQLRNIHEATRLAAKKRIRLSLYATGIAIVGTVYPVFSIAGILAVLYLTRHVFKLILKDFKKGHYISSYLAAAILILGMIAAGHLILAASMGVIGGFFAQIVNQLEENSQNRLINVFAGHPEKVWVLQDGVELQIDFHNIKAGDLVIVNAGEVIPVDGAVESGIGQLDQHILTGESQPVEKSLGDEVFASTLLLSGRLCIQAKTAGNATVAAKIGQILNHTQNYKDTLIIRGRNITDRFIAVRVGLSAITLPILGYNPALAVMWSDLGSNAGTASPLVILSYLQILARQNILIKDGRIFELLKDVDTIVFDKTGTLTLEQPTIGKIYTFADHQQNDVLRYAAAAEHRQPHPIAKAILAKAEEEGLLIPELDEASYEVGYGIKVIIEGNLVRVGSARFLNREGIELPVSIQSIQEQTDSESHSLTYVSINNQLAGIFEIHPTMRPEAKNMITLLKKRGITLYIISGDHEAPTKYMADELGIDSYFSETLPENKACLVQQLRDEGRFVCFIGDGINDAIALKTAQVSISLKGASSAATDVAQVIFMDGTLNSLEPLLIIADEFEKIMKNNLVTSFGLGAFNIGGVYLLNFGVAVSMGLFYFGIILVLCNSLWPLVKYQEPESVLTSV